MITQDQSAVVSFLSSPAAHGGAPVERIETHASMVFLAGTRAWKLKRAVRYDYLDFSTVERRRAMCEAEVRLNARAAPEVYRRAVPVTRRRDGSLTLDGPGVPVDWLVEMVRFDQEGLFDRLAARGALDLHLMRPLAATIAHLHAAAERRPDHGGQAGMAWVIEGNADGFRRHGAGVLDPTMCEALTVVSRGALERVGALLDRRRDTGLVRQCHGDLHLRNIVLIDGRPTLFDGVEFNDEIACIDVMYDAAFLFMDLWRRHLPRHANVVFNRYLAETGDLAGLAALPLFLSCRAAVRAKTSATAARLATDARRRHELETLAREYLDRALTLLRPPAPSVIAIGGLSGTGKSTLALTLAPSLGAVPGAVVLRSDEVRKHLCGVEALHRLGPEGYSPEVSRRVYEVLGRRADEAVRGGQTVIVDAVFARSEDRAAVEHVAGAADVPFIGLWMDAPESVLMERVQRRGADPSDANAAVIRRQIAEGTGRVRWPHLDASGPFQAVRRRAMEIVEQCLSGRVSPEEMRVRQGTL